MFCRSWPRVSLSGRDPTCLSTPGQWSAWTLHAIGAMSLHEIRNTLSSDEQTSELRSIPHENLAVVEDDSENGEANKARYSKISVWLMVLYSGLAIGSDG